MKPKYYPHITILAAASITIAPLCLVLSLPYLRSSSNFDSVLSAESETFQDGNARPDAVIPDDIQLALTDDGTVPQKSVPANDTRVAMAPHSPVTPRVLAAAPAHRTPAVVAPVSTTYKPESTAILPEDVVPIPRTNAEPPAVVGPSSVEQIVTTQTVPPESAETLAERAKLDAEMNHALTNRPAQKPGTYFDSTGHLAMVNAQRATIAGTRTPPESTRVAKANLVDSNGSRQRRPAAAEPETLSASTSMADSGDSGLGMRDLLPADDAGFGTDVEPELEDVILQQPLENRRVNRVESVVAVTRAKGWPVALVRSDLPDDYWWVQQMVGIRGNAFAARANFGNDSSLPGSVYHMVIVFLDSPDEVRRFRIAKRFKELPDGSRHSREFTFVRQ